MYSKELNAIKKSNRYREKKLFDESLIDLASNDYLGLSEKKQLLNRAVARLDMFKSHAPKSSLAVNGYHQIHKDFEDFLCRQNGFEDAVLAGSGFLANMALIETLPRKGDILLMDSEYHASGIVASKLLSCEVVFFKHNSSIELEECLKKKTYKRAIVAVEGIYSMSGDILNRDIFDVVKKYKKNTILIVDEAHSAGVLGKKLTGIYDFFDIKIEPNHIKMGTLGKAYGSYGAYILGSKQIIEFLQNRAKTLIYATAPSLIDIELAHQSGRYMYKNAKLLNDQIKQRQELVKKIFYKDIKGLIFTYEMSDSQKALSVQEKLKEQGFLVGAIRPPTVEKPIIRVILRLGVDLQDIEKVLRELYM